MLEAYEVGRNALGTLVNELEKRMLSIRSWLTPYDGARLVTDTLSAAVYLLSVTLHNSLLQVGREAM